MTQLPDGRTYDRAKALRERLAQPTATVAIRIDEASAGEHRNNPEKLRLIGARFYYIAKLSGYRLPTGLCICNETPCVCAEAHFTTKTTPVS